MKRTRFWLLGAFVLVSALLVFAVIKRNQSPIYQLSRYPKTRAFKHYVLDLRGELENPYAERNDTLLQISAAPKGDWSEVSGVAVGKSGRFSLGLIYPPQFKVGDARFSDLQPQQLAKIKNLMEQLPPSQPPEKREDLMIVLIYDPPPTQIRLYHRKHPPTQLRAILRTGMEAAEKEFGKNQILKTP